MALPIGPFPFILTDGTLADANQVMANFNLLLNGVNGLAPLGVPLPATATNVRASLTTAGTSVTVAADNVLVATALNGTGYTVTNYSQLFNGATTGAGGMDTGTLPSNGYVALYAIYNPTAPTVSILGTNAGVSSPSIYAGANMPAGYTASALLAVWRTNATPAMVAGVQHNKVFSQSFVQVLNTNTNAASYTSLSIATAVPPVAIACSGTMQLSANGSQALVNPQITIACDGVNQIGFQQVAGVAPNTTVALTIGSYSIGIQTAQTIFYQTTAVSANVTAGIFVNSYTIP